MSQPTETERFLKAVDVRRNSADPTERALALAQIIEIGLTTENPLLRSRATDFLSDHEKVLADFDQPTTRPRLVAG